MPTRCTHAMENKIPRACSFSLYKRSTLTTRCEMQDVRQQGSFAEFLPCSRGKCEIDYKIFSISEIEIYLDSSIQIVKFIHYRRIDGIFVNEKILQQILSKFRYSLERNVNFKLIFTQRQLGFLSFDRDIRRAVSRTWT